MDTILHCNDLNCRANVPDQAVVTTCSHIFCIPCANRLGLAEPKDGRRSCPACKTELINPDDAVIASLSPTEDYKTSILSGLSPTIIMECAGRGLGFWAYQMAQEITYQQYLGTSLAERYQQLGLQLEAVTNKEKDENNRLRQRLDALQAENANLIETNAALDRSYKEKAKAQLQINNLYQKLKAQQMAAGLEFQADADADNVLAHASQQQRPGITQRPGGNRNTHGRGNSDGSDERRNRDYTWGPHNTSQGYQSNAAPRPGHGASQSLPLNTPQQHANRQRLPRPTFGHYNSTLLGGITMGSASMRQGTSNRAPYGSNQGYVQSGYGDDNAPGNGYGSNAVGGISAGVRMGRPPQANMPLSRAGMGSARPGGFVGMNMR